GVLEKVQFSLPTLITMETNFAEPSYASLPSILNALGKEIKRYDLKMIGLSITSDIKIRTVGLSWPVPRPKKAFTPGSHLTAGERRRLLLSGGALNKKESIDYLDGNADVVSSQVVKFLRENKLILS
ncbi:hypothetical protein ACFLXC_01565, partial [Chloroflexota bacterium]